MNSFNNTSFNNTSFNLKRQINQFCKDQNTCYNNYSKNLINKLDELMNNPLECKKMGKAARKFVVSNFSKEDVLCRMTLKVESLLRSNQFIPY